ncbi:MAG: hypothetical protein GY944_05050 [bacterium]|nr:hypothetical protein [bacterium]
MAAQKKTARKVLRRKASGNSKTATGKAAKPKAKRSAGASSKKRPAKKSAGTKRRKAAATPPNGAPAVERASKRGPGRPPGGESKTRGSQVSRRQIRQIAQRILKEAKGRTREEASARTGAHVDDIKNLKAGNLPSLKLFLRVVRDGRYDPEVLIKKNELKKLPASVSTRSARAKLISERIRKVAKDGDPATLAQDTGLSIYTIYQHRVANKRVGLHTILAFVDAGAVSAREVFLGRT